MLRPKNPAQVRIDALRVGAEKLVSGCPTCADGYFSLQFRMVLARRRFDKLSQLPVGPHPSGKVAEENF
jgi:hypothetical protein